MQSAIVVERRTGLTQCLFEFSTSNVISYFPSFLNVFFVIVNDISLLVIQLSINE